MRSDSMVVHKNGMVAAIGETDGVLHIDGPGHVVFKTRQDWVFFAIKVRDMYEAHAREHTRKCKQAAALAEERIAKLPQPHGLIASHPPRDSLGRLIPIAALSWQRDYPGEYTLHVETHRPQRDYVIGNFYLETDK